MHIWGDDWFEKYGDELDTAISEITKGLHKYRIGVYMKEKWGSAREECLNFWDGGLYTLLYPSKSYIGTNGKYKHEWLKNAFDSLHKFIYFKLDKCLRWFNTKIGLVDLVQRLQERGYNKVYQRVFKKHPNIVDELVCDIDGYEMIKPCRWGDVDGVGIHRKYWKKL